jgi:phosphate starvation-inducible protein PhoH and related proteins
MFERTLHFASGRLIAELLGPGNQHLPLIEGAFGVQLVSRDDWVQIRAANDVDLNRTESLFRIVEAGRRQGLRIGSRDFAYLVGELQQGHDGEIEQLFATGTVINLRRQSVVPRTLNQKRYLQSIAARDVVFGIGPAGTGKTYLAVAAALDALQKETVDRIILTRPAVEAGEALGFLPGDLTEKIQPYLLPLYDAIYETMGRAEGRKLIGLDLERKEDRANAKIEIAPLAYMRGRTLSRAFVILDEAQNTTPEQMMMFLTRLGEGSRMVITGDKTQVDLPRHKYSGLKEAEKVLCGVDGIAFHYLDGRDVVRHPLVQSIIEAYAAYELKTGAHHPREVSAD